MPAVAGAVSGRSRLNLRRSRTRVRPWLAFSNSYAEGIRHGDSLPKLRISTPPGWNLLECELQSGVVGCWWRSRPRGERTCCGTGLPDSPRRGGWRNLLLLLLSPCFAGRPSVEQTGCAAQEFCPVHLSRLASTSCLPGAPVERQTCVCHGRVAVPLDADVDTASRGEASDPRTPPITRRLDPAARPAVVTNAATRLALP